MPPVVEEFGEFVYSTAEILLGAAAGCSSSPAVANFDATYFYQICAIKARELEIPHRDIYPLASLVYDRIRIDGGAPTPCRHPFHARGQFVVMSRPPSYLAGLDRFVQTEGYDLIGQNTEERPHSPSSITLSPDWNDVPLWCPAFAGGANRPRPYFNPAIYSGPLATSPNWQTQEFYIRVATGLHAPHVKVSRSLFDCIGYTRFASLEEIEQFFTRLPADAATAFPSVDIVNTLSCVGVPTNVLHQAIEEYNSRVGRQGAMPPPSDSDRERNRRIPPVATDVRVEPSPALRPSRTRRSTITTAGFPSAADRATMVEELEPTPVQPAGLVYDSVGGVVRYPRNSQRPPTAYSSAPSDPAVWFEPITIPIAPTVSNNV